MSHKWAQYSPQTYRKAVKRWLIREKQNLRTPETFYKPNLKLIVCFLAFSTLAVILNPLDYENSITNGQKGNRRIDVTFIANSHVFAKYVICDRRPMQEIPMLYIIQIDVFQCILSYIYFKYCSFNVIKILVNKHWDGTSVKK